MRNRLTEFSLAFQEQSSHWCLAPVRAEASFVSRGRRAEYYGHGLDLCVSRTYGKAVKLQISDKVHSKQCIIEISHWYHDRSILDPAMWGDDGEIKSHSNWQPAKKNQTECTWTEWIGLLGHSDNVALSKESPEVTFLRVLTPDRTKRRNLIDNVLLLVFLPT